MVTKRIMTLNKKEAFTLVEVLTSIVLLGLIFTYLSSTINSVKQQNNNYIEKSDLLQKEKKLFLLFNLDLAQSITPIVSNVKGRYDIVNFKSKNSIYDIIDPHITYFVSKKDNALIRVESLEGFDIKNKDQLTKTFLYADILTPNCKSFKADYTNGVVTVMFRAQDIKPMVFKIPTVSQ